MLIKIHSFKKTKKQKKKEKQEVSQFFAYLNPFFQQKINPTEIFYSVEYGSIILANLNDNKLGGSRKYPYPYHGRHLGIPKGRGGYIDWNSEDMGGFIGLEFRRHGGIFRRVTSSLV